MDDNLLVKITVPRVDGKTRTGTGYTVAKGLVLTARHVVEFPERDKKEAILLEWVKLSTPNQPCSATVQVVKVGDWEQYDIALLEFTLPAEITVHFSVCVFAKTKAISGEQWESAGFPKINQFQLKGATGQFSKDLGNATLDLDLSNTYDRNTVPNDMVSTGWGGMSGAPVFGVKSKQLQAVVTVHHQWMEKQLVAVSIPWLLQNSQCFRNAVESNSIVANFNDNTVECQQFLKEQKQQILEHLEDIQSGKLFKQLTNKLKTSAVSSTPSEVNKRLLALFERDCLNLLDLLLQASSDALEQSHSPEILDNVQRLFCLFASLMASTSFIVREVFIHLSVYSKMATELNLAPLYNTNPHFTLTKDGEVVGKYAIDASEFTKEVGWEVDQFKDEALKVIYTGVRKRAIPKQFNTFELKKLNAMIKQRQNKSLNKLHRFELNCCDNSVVNNPLHDTVYCQALIAKDCLPDLPIVHFGEAEAMQEAELSAKIDELFEILNRYEYTP